MVMDVRLTSRGQNSAATPLRRWAGQHPHAKSFSN
jgi:hypothetical protein